MYLAKKLQLIFAGDREDFNRDHTTVIHAVKAIELSEQDDERKKY